MKYTYKTKSVCASQIEIEIDKEVVKSVNFSNGCSGNLQAISKLVAGQPIDKVIQTLKGINCRGGTSCPDQLSIALQQIKNETN